MQTDKADIHAEVTAQEVEELPYNGGEGKNFQSLLFLHPGRGHLSPAAGSQLRSRQSAARHHGVHERRLVAGQQHPAGRRHDLLSVAAGQRGVRTAAGSHPDGQRQHQRFRRRTGRGGRRGGQRHHQVGHQPACTVSVFERNTNNQLAAVNNYFSHPGRLAEEHLQPVRIRARRSDLDSQDRSRQEQIVLLPGLPGHQAASIRRRRRT